MQLRCWRCLAIGVLEVGSAVPTWSIYCEACELARRHAVVQYVPQLTPGNDPTSEADTRPAVMLSVQTTQAPPRRVQFLRPPAAIVNVTAVTPTLSISSAA